MSRLIIKSTTLLLVLMFVFVSGQLNAQTYIPTQVIFEAEILAVWDSDGSPYILGIEDDLDPGATEFTIDDDEDLVIEGDVEVQLAEGVTLFIDGSITVGDVAEPLLETTFMPYDGERWDSIVLRGNAEDNQDGVGTFYYTTIYGGGESAGGHNGLIVLTNWDPADLDAPDPVVTSTPKLFMQGNGALDYSLYDSESCGIAVVDEVPEDAGDVAVSSNIEIIDMVIGGNKINPIEANGIHYHELVDLWVESALNLERVDVTDCGERGIYHEMCRAMTENPDDEGSDGFDLDIVDCKINANGSDGFYFECPDIGRGGIEDLEDMVDVGFDIEDSEFNYNGSVQTGWGFKVNELPASIDGQAGNQPSISYINVTGSSFDENSQGGFCLWHTTFVNTHIDECTFNNNGEDAEEDNFPLVLPNYAEIGRAHV